MYRRISLTTDLTDASHGAFLHALSLARTWQASLDILHVRDPEEDPHWELFPQIRSTLERWGVKNLPSALGRQTSIDGLHFNKVDLPSNNAVRALSKFTTEHGTDLIVAASHGRLGLNKLIHGSVTEEILQKTKLPALLIGPEARTVVNDKTGAMAIERVVFPVAARPDPGEAEYELSQFLREKQVEVHHIHVRDGSSLLDTGFYHGKRIALLDGQPAPEIVNYARKSAADMIVMATEGSKGMKDALFGSTTTQVVAHAPCPVLVVPK